MIVGYARVSSIGQSLEVQRKRLLEAGCEKIFEEKLSGTTAQRPQYQALKTFVREGDSIYVTKLDRLARSVLDLNKFIQMMNEKDVRVRFLDQDGFDTQSPTGKFLIQMLAAVAEFENELRRERTNEGIKAAKAKGVKFGRPFKLTDSQVDDIIEKRENGTPTNAILKEYSISKATMYRLMKIRKAQLESNQLKLLQIPS